MADLPQVAGGAERPMAIEKSAAAGFAEVADEELALIAALRAGDRAAFAVLIDRHGRAMLRVARMYVATAEAAEDVVQETWLGVVRGIDRFEGRSSLKTWIFRILANRAQTRGGRDARTVPFSSLLAADEDAEPSVPAERFRADGRWAGFWASPPAALPEERLLAREMRANLEAVIEALPDRQRAVITLRDIQGLSSTEACGLLGLSEANQRVLLHRARCRVRAELEGFVHDGGGRS